MKVLVVDDSKAMRMIVIRTLRQIGINNLTTIEACHGVEALAMIADHKPHAVLSDWNMPEMKGIDLLKNLRTLGNDILFGFVTSECSADAKKEATEAGAKFFIVKPFTTTAFEAALSSLIA